MLIAAYEYLLIKWPEELHKLGPYIYNSGANSFKMQTFKNH